MDALEMKPQRGTWSALGGFMAPSKMPCVEQSGE
jgi:hypothetical protein